MGDHFRSRSEERRIRARLTADSPLHDEWLAQASAGNLDGDDIKSWHLMELADEILDLRALVPEWRDVKTCPPTEDGKCLVCCPSADPERPLIATAWWHAAGGWSLLPDYWRPAIRYWMPLPAPPAPTITPGTPS